jgi:hypothetical protein
MRWTDTVLVTPFRAKVWAEKQKFPLDVSLWIRAFERRSSHAGSVMITLY